MEPFSLLPFLQSLIRAQNNAQPAEQTPPQTEKESVENTPTSSLQEEKDNACLHFFSAHDERVRRTKKP